MGVIVQQEWGTFAQRSIMIPLCVQVFICIVLVPLSRLWVSRKWFEFEWISKYVGSQFFKPEKPDLYVSLKLMQLICSLSSVCIWAIRSYERANSLLAFEVLCLPLFVISYMVEMMKFGCNPRDAMGVPNLIDVFTIIPALVTLSGGYPDHQWVSLLYLRVYPAVDSFHDIEASGFQIPLSDFAREVILLSLRSIALVVVLAGSVLTLELMGELPFLQDSFIPTEMGDLSFFQMIYWVFTTCSTVGYGDFAPKTVLSRMFSCVAIVVGVVFFGSETNKLVELQEMQGSGQGSYSVHKTSKHIVITGGGVHNCGQVLYSLIEELYPSEEENKWPDCVIMSSSPQPDSMKNYFETRLPPHIQARILYLVGSPMLEGDLHRARVADAVVVYVLADAAASDADKEDGQNFLRALSVRRHFPDVSLRLMLLKEETRRWAMNTGFSKDCCFSLQELKANLLAHSTYCHGFITLISNLLDSDDVPNKEMGDEIWRQEYCNGTNNTIYGSLVPRRYIGLPWAEFTCKLFEDTGATAIGAQMDGSVVLNPGQQTDAPVEENTVVFFITYEHEDVADEDVKHEHWTGKFSIVRHGHSKNQKGQTAHHGSVDSPRVKKSHVSTKQGRQRPRTRMDKSDLSGLDGHILLVACSPDSSNWLQITMVLDACLTPGREWENRVIVVLATDDAPADVAGDFSCVVFLRGSALNAGDLEAAQAQYAADVVLLSDVVPQVDRDEFKDQHTVLIANSIESFLANTERSVSVIYDFFNADSAGFLPELTDKVGPKDRITTSMSAIHYSRDKTTSKRTWKKHLDLWTDSMRLQSRFACGQLFTLNLVGHMLGREYYVPSSVEVLLTLVAGDQDSLPWLVPVPEELKHANYLEIFQTWCQGPDIAIPLGIRRFLYPDATRGMDRELGYIITNPTGDFRLHAADQVYVLGSAKFGERMLGTALFPKKVCGDSGAVDAKDGVTGIQIGTQGVRDGFGVDLAAEETCAFDDKRQNLEAAITKVHDTLAALMTMRVGEFHTSI